ncbi:MAG: helix-turn-helix domain-containing protein [Chloroflexi bacterium]|nr:helix-turn-helix domain-containing protein [Chloroflexota bacterium]
MRLHFPQARLSRYIQCFWQVDLQIPYRREHILPSCTVELIINFGSGFRVYDHDDPQKFDLNRRMWLVGLQTEHIINEPIAETNMIGIRFKPEGVYSFFGIPASEFQNRIVELDAVWVSEAELWREALYHAPTIDAKFETLEQLLCRKLTDNNGQLDVVQFALRSLAADKGMLSIKALSDDIGISQKHLASQFKKYVGVSPKTMARLYRFQHVLHTIDPTRPIDWAQIAYEFNYYDQSHFNKEFAAFTGFSPTQYMANRRAVYGDSLCKGDGVHFVPAG